MSLEISAFGDLFAGAARLGLMLGAFDVPWTRVAPLIAPFPSELDAHLELSTGSGEDAAVALTTWGEGKSFAHRLARVFEEQGVSSDELRRFLVRAAHLGHRPIEATFRLSGTEALSLGYVLRARHDLATAQAMLADAGADDDLVRLAFVAASGLGRDEAHGFGATLSPGSPTTSTLWLALHAGSGVAARLLAAADELDAKSDALASACSILEESESAKLFAGVEVRAGRLSLSLRAEGLGASAVGGLEALLPEPARSAERRETLLKVHGASRPEAVSLSFDVDGLRALDVHVR